MELTDTEQAREEQQRREAAIFQSAEMALFKKISLVVGGLAAGVTVLGFVSTTAWWFSTRAARDEVSPVRDMARDNAASIIFMKEDLNEIKDALNAQTAMLRKALGDQ